MSLLFLIAKTILIIFFLVMFLRTNKAAWGIGLLTVTSAILLDTFLGTLGRAQMMEEMGYFFYIIAGALFAGATIWLWAIVKDFVFNSNQAIKANDVSENTNLEQNDSNRRSVEAVEIHRQISDLLRFTLSYDDLLDLIFDMGWFGDELDTLQDDNMQFVQGIVALAEARDQLDSLKLACERIITPIPPEHLPRLEKLKEDSPPTLLRHFLVANYSMAEIEQLIEALNIDGESSPGRLKNSNVRYLLSDLYQNNRLGMLIKLMQQSSKAD